MNIIYSLSDTISAMSIKYIRNAGPLNKRGYSKSPISKKKQLQQITLEAEHIIKSENILNFTLNIKRWATHISIE